nr:bifunctional diguanylate cyclase/phosphodiesterase [uncultured Gellertiella sp.]
MKPQEAARTPMTCLDLPDAVLGKIRTPLWIFDFDLKRIVWANRAAVVMWRAETSDELYARDLGRDMSASVALRLKQYREDFLRLDTSFSEYWTVYPHGEPVSTRVVFTGIRLADGRIAMLCEAGEELEETPETRRSTDALLHTSVMITLTDMGGSALYRNPASRTSVPTNEQRLEQRLLRRQDYRRIQSALERDGEIRIVAEASTTRGTCWHEMTIRKCRDTVTGLEALLITEVDVSDLKDAERRANYLAHRDPLTRLANRGFIQQEGQRRLESGAEENRLQALLFIDLDRFKNINDSLGHSVGDRVLVEVANRISDIAGPNDIVGRLGGDEFVVLLHPLADREAIERVAIRICDALARPLSIEHHELLVTPSIGIATYPDNAGSIEELTKNADIAMYAAKGFGRNGYYWYSPSMADDAQRRMTIEIKLRRAVEQNELQVYYQPRVDVQTGRIVGAEALLRWTHETLGSVSPATFIPILEETGLIRKVGMQVLTAAVRQQLAWKGRGHTLNLAINVSSLEFRLPRYVDDVLGVLQSLGANPADFELEITESLLLSNDEATRQKLNALKDAGISIAVDDFGTGYSNLAYMQQYPINCLKIDRSFIMELDHHSAIAEMIISMCRLLNLRIVAEGVETPEQLAWLQARQCQEYQGFLFSRPVPPEDFALMLEAR